MKSEQKVETFQNLDFIVLQHLSSVEDLRDTGRSKEGAHSSSSQEDQSAIEAYNKKHQFMKISNVRDLINQEENGQEEVEELEEEDQKPVCLKDLNVKLDDMTSCINEMKKKREAKS